MSQLGVNLILGSNDFEFLNLIIMSHFDNIIYARKSQLNCLLVKLELVK
jgi:hypothetical protein